MRCFRCGIDYLNFCTRCREEDAVNAKIALVLAGYIAGLVVMTSLLVYVTSH